MWFVMDEQTGFEFNKQNIIKILFIVFSSFFWIYFLISSRLNLVSIIIFDFYSIIKAMSSLNFLLFLIFFPITSVIILSVIFNSTKKESLIIIGAGLLFTIAVSAIFLRLNRYFIFFLVLYTLIHIVMCFIVKKETTKSSYNHASELLSKVSLFLIIAIFIATALYILPNQKTRVEEFEAGIVNLFIADDLGPWMNTSYIISKQCTLSNLKYIMESSEYITLTRNTDTDSLEFTEFMDNLKNSASANRTPEEIKELMPDLDAPVVKSKIVSTVKAIPFMNIIEGHFAIFFAFIFASLTYSYLSISFLLFAALIYLFNKILK